MGLLLLGDFIREIIFVGEFKDLKAQRPSYY